MTLYYLFLVPGLLRESNTDIRQAHLSYRKGSRIWGFGDPLKSLAIHFLPWTLLCAPKELDHKQEKASSFFFFLSFCFFFWLFFTLISWPPFAGAASWQAHKMVLKLRCESRLYYRFSLPFLMALGNTCQSAWIKTGFKGDGMPMRLVSLLPWKRRFSFRQLLGRLGSCRALVGRKLLADPGVGAYAASEKKHWPI